MAESGHWVTIRGHRVFISDSGKRAAVVVPRPRRRTPEEVKAARERGERVVGYAGPRRSGAEAKAILDKQRDKRPGAVIGGIGTHLEVTHGRKRGRFPTEQRAAERYHDELHRGFDEGHDHGNPAYRGNKGRRSAGSRGVSIAEGNRRAAASARKVEESGDYARAWYIAGGGGSSVLGPYENESDARASFERTTDSDFADGVVVKGYAEAMAKHRELVHARRQRGKDRGL